MASICEKLPLPHISIEDIKAYLSSPNTDINTPWDCNGEKIPYTPLVCACLNQKEEIVDYLLSKGADVNIGTDAHKHSCAHIAVNFQNLKILTKLIEFGVNVNDQTSWNRITLLHAAVYKKNYEIVKYLIDKGADVNIMRICNADTVTPFMTAVSLRLLNILQLLIENGADVNVQGKYFGNALGRSVILYKKEIFEFLLEHRPDVTSYTFALEKDTLIHTLSIRGFSEPLDFLLHRNNDLDINSLNWNNDTGLHIASRYQSKDEFYTQILDIGIDINVVNSEGKLAIEFTHENVSYKDKFIDHIIKLIVANCYVCEGNLKAVEKQLKEKKAFFEECEAEIVKTKTTKILDSNIFYYDIIHTSELNLAIDLKFYNVYEIKKLDLLNLFPLYGGIIYYRLLRIVNKIKLLKNVKAIDHKL